MTTLTQTVRKLPVAPDDDGTKVGNYFVSNYPPYAYWHDDQLDLITDAMDTPPAPGNPLGMYVHIPFCRKRCHFCYFKVYTDKNAAAIGEYIQSLIGELKMLVERAFVGGRKPQFIYFGGGTPSYLSAKQLTELTEGLKAVLPWDEAVEIAFECEPGTLNENKLAAIRDMGVTRLSFGIENFNDHILEINGRAHLSKQVYAAYDWARAIGFPQINVDLIAGMLEETTENWIDNVRRTIDMDPDMVTMYQMEVPYNTGIYKQMKEEGKLVAPVADWDTKRRWSKYAFEQLEQVGYTQTSAYTMVKDPATKFVYRDSLWQGADMIALGVSSFGHINKTHYQNIKHIEPYCESISQGKLPLSRTYRINEEESIIREMILQIKTGRLNLTYFQDKFGVDLLQKFVAPYSKYIDAGYMRVVGDEVILDRDTLLQVETLLYDFFLPQHKGTRYV